MSTIDRAIQKLEGRAGPKRRKEQKEELEQEYIEDPLFCDEDIEQALIEEKIELKPEPELIPEPKPRAEAESAIEPEVFDDLPVESPPLIQLETPRPTAQEQTSNFVNLDFERLGAAGFMTPDMADNHMTEEYQAIKRRLLGNMVEGMSPSKAPTNLIMVTSSVPGEGKTFTTLNLAISMAKEMDRTVLVVDTDIIKSDLTRLLGVEDRKGLFDILSDNSYDLGDLLVKTNVPNLSVLPAGHAHGGISEKLASEAMFRLVNELAERYSDRVIIFDCPPVLATSGAAALAPYIGQIVMVAEAVKTPQGIIKHAMRALEHVKVTGMILNKSRLSHPISDYQYGYYYHQQKKK